MSDARIRIREGTPDDLPLVLRHRRGMFRDMGDRDEERLDAMEAVSAPFFATGLRNQALYLHASDEGRALYASLGFVATNEMRLTIG